MRNAILCIDFLLSITLVIAQNENNIWYFVS